MTAPPHISAIFVTYKMNIGLLKNVIRLLRHVPAAQVVVVDNSPQHYKSAFKLSSALARLAEKHNRRISYIDHQVNSRFAAYNAGLAKADDDFVVFRTDDDYFDETNTARALRHSIPTWAVTPHYFNQSLQAPKDHRRPLETAVFAKAFLTALLPFKDAPSADWLLLEQALAAAPPNRLAAPILHKAGHGRPQEHCQHL